MQATEATLEAKRAIEICNACRYCEGYCAVFPAMDLQRDFTVTDMGYLANLCHNCNGCYHACQFSPPHEFGINLPKTFAEVRLETYAEYAWPKPLARAFERNGVVVGLVMAASIAFVLIATMLIQSSTVLFSAHTGAGAFYRIIPWGVMAAVAGASFVYSIVALAVGAVRFWRDTKTGLSGPITFQALRHAVHDVATLRYLGGAGEGCNDLDVSFSMTRRHFHHALMYGFLLCFASTSTATLMDHFLGWEAPYSWYSLPVVLGTLGGIGMIAGCCGLIWVKIATDPAPVSRRVLGGDYALLVLLLMAALTGLGLLLLRATPAMGILLAVHLGFILALFLVLPYGKFVHGIYRGTALLKAAIERQRNTLVGEG
jgi:citrate/tricarballylate utilization protein